MRHNSPDAPAMSSPLPHANEGANIDGVGAAHLELLAHLPKHWLLALGILKGE